MVPRRAYPTRVVGTLRVLAVALALVFAQGPRLLHLILVPHELCEHGQLVDSAGHHRHGDVAKSDAPGIREATRAEVEHEHCDALALRHRPELAVTPWVGEATLLTLLAESEVLPSDETRPVDLLALAPKSSPPTTA